MRAPSRFARVVVAALVAVSGIALSASPVPGPAVASAAPDPTTASNVHEPIARPEPAQAPDPTEVVVEEDAPAVSIAPDSIDAGVTTLALEIAEDLELDDARVRVVAEGAAKVAGATPTEVEDGDEALVGATIGEGDGVLTAVLEGTAADGSPVQISHSTWVTTVSGVAYASEASADTARLASVEGALDRGIISVEQAQADRERLGGTVALEPSVPSDQAAACVTICVDVTVVWTDRAGGKHPVRRATVDIVENNATGNTAIARVVTGEDGRFISTLPDNIDPEDSTGRDIYFAVYARGPGFAVITYQGASPVEHSAVTTVSRDLAAGTSITGTLTAGTMRDAHTAFSVQDAVVTAVDAGTALTGSAPAAFSVSYPQAGSDYSSALRRLGVAGNDHFDWDAVFHEYGHLLANDYFLATPTGGTHGPLELLSARYDKDKGTRLAWSEGLATYLAISTQVDANVAARGVPSAGDVVYDDTDAVGAIHENLETGRNLGEDNESTVAAFLWDLYDATNEPGDRVTLGARAIFQALAAARPARLSDAYAALRTAAGDNSANVDCVAGHVNVAPKITSIPASSSTPLRVEWSRGNGGEYANNKSVVDVQLSDGTLLHRSSELNGTSYTIPDAAWASIVAARGGGSVFTTVLGKQTGPPATQYRSCYAPTTVTQRQKVDVVFAIDTTASMSDDIAAVKARAASITTSLMERADAQVGLVEYRDVGTAFLARPVLSLTSNTSSILSAIQSLQVDPRSNRDEPETVLSGVMTALAQRWRSDADQRVVIVLGDAPAKDPEPTTGYTRRSVAAAAANLSASVSRAPGADVTNAGSATQRAVIHSIIIGADPAAARSLTDLARSTGGVSISSPDAQSVVDAITRALVVATTSAEGNGKRVPSRYVSLDPSRLLDTRGGAPVAAGTTRSLTVAGAGGVPPTGVNAVVLNVTATDPRAGGYVTVYPTGEARPPTSNLNVAGSGSTRANLVTVAVGPNGSVELFASMTTHLLVDVAGYYTTASTSTDGRFVGQVPRRLLDTRPTARINSNGTKPAPGSTTTVVVAGHAGIPSTGTPAVVLNVTATESNAPGYVTVWPAGLSRPTVSNVNLDAANQTRPNQVIVPLGPTGAISLYTDTGAHLIVDVVGYYSDGASPSAAAGLFVPMTPTRVHDSRSGRRPAAGSTITVSTGRSGAALLNVTMTDPASSGYVTVWPAGAAFPIASNLNANGAGETSAAHVVATTDALGRVSLYTSTSSHLVVDKTGEFLAS